MSRRNVRAPRVVYGVGRCSVSLLVEPLAQWTTRWATPRVARRSAE